MKRLASVWIQNLDGSVVVTGENHTDQSSGGANKELHERAYAARIPPSILPPK
jgi:hypothetical protein